MADQQPELHDMVALHSIAEISVPETANSGGVRRAARRNIRLGGITVANRVRL
jgi:hypothetical protein